MPSFTPLVYLLSFPFFFVFLPSFFPLPSYFISFLDKIDIISSPDYIPDDQDILRCRRRTSDIQKIEFEVRVPLKYGGGTQLFWYAIQPDGFMSQGLNVTSVFNGYW